MPTLNDYNRRSSSTPFQTSVTRKKKFTLDDLRNDKKFQETAERFLMSVGEGEDVDDLFGYFRGAD